jgi:arginyl-tRNA synthetase
MGKIRYKGEKHFKYISSNITVLYNKLRLFSILYRKLRLFFPWQAWQKICEASRVEFELIYQRLGITIQERGESFYNPLLAPLVSELLANEIAQESEGAKVDTK